MADLSVDARIAIENAIRSSDLSPAGPIAQMVAKIEHDAETDWRLDVLMRALAEVDCA